MYTSVHKISQTPLPRYIYPRLFARIRGFFSAIYSSPHSSLRLRGFFTLVLLCLVCRSASAVDQVTYRRDGKTAEVTGRLLVKTDDGVLLILARDGVISAIEPNDLIKHVSNDEKFASFSRDETAKRILAGLPQGFRMHSTAHYLICYDTSTAYAQWCGALFERLYSAFTNYWSRQGFDLAKPEFPLVAVLFADRAAYLKHSRAELGDGNTAIGYYSIITNRMTMYDLTGVEANSRGRGRVNTAAQINQILAQPDAERTVATVVHEATHQIAFNCGLHARLSDCPLWFCEGIAVYFETPDLSSAKGWRGIGAVNESRLEQFQQYLPSRPPNSLETLIRDDTRFHEAKQILDAYGEAWALTYFLLRQHPKEYVRYLAMLSKKTPLIHDGPEKRLQQFREVFGDLSRLDTEFLRYMNKMR
jgi:hypothetical protein